MSVVLSRFVLCGFVWSLFITIRVLMIFMANIMHG